MNALTRPLESFTLVAPLGVRFHDEATREAIVDGLVVTASPIASTSPISPLGASGQVGPPAPRVLAFPNRSGTYVFHHLPGLRGSETGTGNAAFWNAPPATRSFKIEVADAGRQFLPCGLTLTAPRRAIFDWTDPFESPPIASPPASSPRTPLGVPLFSAPTRPAPAGMAVVRIELWDAGLWGSKQAQPAAWAFVEAWIDGARVARGLADERGRAALFFSYPEPRRIGTASPVASPLSAPVSTDRALTEQTWEVELRAFYCRRIWPEVPALEEVLAQRQAAPSPLSLVLSPPSPLPPQALRFGRELVVKSPGQSVVLVQSAV